jgi:hypothetical protein
MTSSFDPAAQPAARQEHTQLLTDEGSILIRDRYEQHAAELRRVVDGSLNAPERAELSALLRKLEKRAQTARVTKELPVPARIHARQARTRAACNERATNPCTSGALLV